MRERERERERDRGSERDRDRQGGWKVDATKASTGMP